VPAAISFAADHSTDNHRASVTIAVTTGLSFGAAAGGILSSYLIGHFGWRSVFISGGVLALLLLPFVWKHMYETSYPSRDRAGIEKADFTSLFRDGATSATSLIWLLAFVSFLVTYLFMFWVPTLLASFGFSPTQAPLGSGAFGLGGVTGNVVLIPLVRRFGPQRLVIAMSLLAICCLGGLAFGDFHATVVLLLIAGVGAGVVTACVSQSTLAVLCYPRGLRTIGLGSAAAVGRLGSVVGPALGGALMADGIAPRMIMLAACVPVLLVILILAASWKAERRT